MVKNIRIFGKPLGLILLVIYEALFGLTKVILGSFLILGNYLVGISVSSQFIQKITGRELAEDPQDVFARWALAHSFTNTTATHIGWLLVILGLINFAIAIGVWFRSWAVRNFGLFFFTAIGIFGMYEVVFVRLSFLTILGLAIDLFFAYYFWKKLPKYLADPAA